MGKEVQLREALKKDFRKLYVEGYTTTWESERMVREIEIDNMSLSNTLVLFNSGKISTLSRRRRR